MASRRLATLRWLWIGSLPVPPDPSNAVADDPRAAALGQAAVLRHPLQRQRQGRLRHLPPARRDFQDGMPLAQGVGTTERRTMPMAGTPTARGSSGMAARIASGRRRSARSKARSSMAARARSTRTLIESSIGRSTRRSSARCPNLSEFPSMPARWPTPPRAPRGTACSDADRDAVTRVYVNIGKAIAAYERQILPAASRFDSYVADLTAGRASDQLTADEVAGLRLFVGKARCMNCHIGPLLTNGDFHNTGVPERVGLPGDTGRAAGAQKVLGDEFNCLSHWSDAKPEDCTDLRFLKAGTHELERQFKPPSLRNVAERGPYMDAGQFATLREVLDHYNTAPAAPAGHSEVSPLNLSDAQLRQLEAFLRTLSAVPTKE